MTQDVSRADVVVTVNGIGLRAKVTRVLAARLADPDVRALHRRSTTQERPHKALLATTPHGFEGHEAELVPVVGADAFTARDGDATRTLVPALCVALTRACSLLLVSALAQPVARQSRRTVAALCGCRDQLAAIPPLRSDLPPACWRCWPSDAAVPSLWIGSPTSTAALRSIRSRSGGPTPLCSPHPWCDFARVGRALWYLPRRRVRRR